MYDFAIVALLGLAVLKVAELLEELVPGLDRFHTLMTFTLGLVAAVAADYSLFAGYHVVLRESWMGTWGTGLIVGAFAAVWRAALGYLTPGAATTSRPARTDRPRVAA
jgi:hypothetical protein